MNTYFTRFSDNIPNNTEVRNKNMISYYQWTPFFLGIKIIKILFNKKFSYLCIFVLFSVPYMENSLYKIRYPFKGYCSICNRSFKYSTK